MGSAPAVYCLKYSSGIFVRLSCPGFCRIMTENAPGHSFVLPSSGPCRRGLPGRRSEVRQRFFHCSVTAFGQVGYRAGYFDIGGKAFVVDVLAVLGEASSGADPESAATLKGTA